MPGTSSFKKEAVIITIEAFNGSFILEGYGEGEFFTAEMDGDGHTKTNGSHQFSTVNRMDLPGGTISLNLYGGSPSNGILNTIWRQRKLDNISFFAITARDVLSGGKLVHSSKALITNVPPLKFGDEIQEVEWGIMAMDLDIQHAGQLLSA